LIKRIFSVLLLSLLLVSPAMSEQTYKQMRRQTSDYFGTVCALFLYDTPENTALFEEAWVQTKNILSQVEQAVSVRFGFRRRPLQCIAPGRQHGGLRHHGRDPENRH